MIPLKAHLAAFLVMTPLSVRKSDTISWSIVSFILAGHASPFILSIFENYAGNWFLQSFTVRGGAKYSHAALSLAALLRAQHAIAAAGGA